MLHLPDAPQRVLRQLNRRAFAATGLAAALGGAVALDWRLPQLREPGAYQPASRIIGDDYPFRVEDPVGTTLTIRTPPRRIVTTGWPSDEAMMLLTGGERVVSCSSSVDDVGISNVAGLYAANVVRNKNRVEEIIALQPDLIVVTAGASASYVKTMMGAGIPVVRFSFYDSFASVDRNLRSLARLVDARARAEAVLADMWARLVAVERAVHGVCAPRVLWADTGARIGSLYDETLIRAGARNVAAEMPNVAHPENALPKELQLASQPEVILYGGNWGRGKLLGDMIRTAPEWRDVPALRSGRLYSINMAWCTTGSPYRVRGVEQIARYLHPRRFAA